MLSPLSVGYRLWLFGSSILYSILNQKMDFSMYLDLMALGLGH